MAKINIVMQPGDKIIVGVNVGSKETPLVKALITVYESGEGFSIDVMAGEGSPVTSIGAAAWNREVRTHTIPGGQPFIAVFSTKEPVIDSEAQKKNKDEPSK